MTTARQEKPSVPTPDAACESELMREAVVWAAAWAASCSTRYNMQVSPEWDAAEAVIDYRNRQAMIDRVAAHRKSASDRRAVEDAKHLKELGVIP
jgi:hypothetical protein